MKVTEIWRYPVKTMAGEKLVMRVIDGHSPLQTLDRLGYDPETLDRLQRSLARPAVHHRGSADQHVARDESHGLRLSGAIVLAELARKAVDCRRFGPDSFHIIAPRKGFSAGIMPSRLKVRKLGLWQR